MIMEIVKTLSWLLALGVYTSICYKLHKKIFGELHLEEIEHHLTPDNLSPMQIKSYHNRYSKIKNINKNYMRRM
jgi:hypothetical protein